MDLNKVNIDKLPADVRKTFRQLQVLHAEKKIQTKAKQDFLSFVNVIRESAVASGFNGKFINLPSSFIIK